MQCAGVVVAMVEKIPHNPQAAYKMLSNQYTGHCQGIYLKQRWKLCSRAMKAADLACTYRGGDEWTMELRVEQGLINVPPDPEEG